MGTGPSLGLLTTGGSLALGNLHDRFSLTNSELDSSQALPGSSEFTGCRNDKYASSERRQETI